MDHHHSHHHEVSQVSIPKERQAVCIVTGDSIDMREAERVGHVRERDGKKIYFCCATCIQLFDENPASYTDHADIG